MQKRPSESIEGLFWCLNSGTPDGLRSHDLHLERVASWTRLDDRGTCLFYYRVGAIGSGLAKENQDRLNADC